LQRKKYHLVRGAAPGIIGDCTGGEGETGIAADPLEIVGEFAGGFAGGDRGRFHGQQSRQVPPSEQGTGGIGFGQ
jgi:hypothetical protein